MSDRAFDGARSDRPKLHEALGQLQAGDTLVIYKPDRVARSTKGTAR